MRLTQNALLINPLSYIIQDFLYQPINITELEPNAWENQDSLSTMRVVDANSAISILISKLSLYSTLTVDYIKAFYTMTLTQLSSFERNFFFIRKNCNGVLRELQEATSAYLADYSQTFFNGVKSVYSYLLLIY